ncbi:MAG TPA: S8 family serine peptidase [Candidatus Polarisedimenticolaceae bacterium]|nr:S8 family serine peptidase [Candidatus Polarisedimenticolaceae bacterium]
MTKGRVLLLIPLLVWISASARAAEGVHKIVAPPGLLDERAQGLKVIADYGSYRVYEISDAAYAGLSGDRREKIAVRDDMDVIQLDAYRLDTRSAVIKIPPALTAGPAAGRALQLVQFVGPVKQEWLDELSAAGIRPVQYIESNAYLVLADAEGRQILDRFAAEKAFLQYSGSYHPYFKLGPTLRGPLSQPVTQDRLVPVVIQIVQAETNAATVQAIESAAASIDSEWESVLTYRNLHMTVPLSRIAGLSALPDVTWVGERLAITRDDEVQDQLVGGHLNAAKTGPSATGYKAFLDGKGFSNDPTLYPIVGLSDDGVGNGSVTNGAGDPTLTKLADGVTTRLSFIGNCSTETSGNSLGGHGHINASVIGGYDVRSGSPYRDSNGYQLGMGVNPYGRMGMTKIFTNTGGYSVPNCGGNDSGVIAATYNSGARISNNSWSCEGCSDTYDAASQTYDARTRDALPGTAGNQQYLFVFSAGNVGPGPTTVGSPSNGKNVIAVGASENFRTGWTDGCNVTTTDADNAMDIAATSSRGPSPGGRAKPDLVAPGTHVQGTASPDPGYTGLDVCDPYMPTQGNQHVFAASSGTSIAAPAVSGAASLEYRWLQTHYLSAIPSPALSKAYLMAHTTYLTGAGANDTLPSNSQGTGMPNLDMAFDTTSRFLLDQSVILDNSGQQWVFHGTVADPTKPVRIVMAYTDAPGSIGTSPQVNNLDLQANVNGTIYNGNVFSGQYSVTGGAPDPANNVESVFLPAGTSGPVTLTVTGFNIAGDGVPGTGDATDQDFALVCYNCATCAATITPDRNAYGCASTMNVVLADSDLKNAGTQTITVNSTVETTAENITLTESPAGSGTFVGSFPTYGGAPVHGDGKISVANGGTVTFSYLDASACGTPNVTVNKVVPIDCAAPSISNVQTVNITGQTVSVTWTTNESTDGSVTYGAAPPPPGIVTPVNPTLTTSHSIPITGLSPCSTYDYAVTSADAAANATVANNAGGFYFFTTLDNVQPNYNYPGPPVSIPDNSTTGASATVNVPDNKSILDVNVTIGSLTHTYDNDLEIHLIGPDSTDVILSNRNGGSGNNYTNTVFDDAATTAIALGLPPFTGSYKPDNPLSAFNGKNALGAWRLFVRDLNAGDVGMINNWTLNLTYPQTACASHARYNTNTTTIDSCNTGGGNGNGVWEPGEQETFKINVASDGTSGVTGVSAVLTATSPGVTIVSGTATYPNIPAGTNADSNAPNFTVKLSSSLTCGSSVSFLLTVKTNEGSWVSTFSHTIGQVSGGCTMVACPAAEKPVNRLFGARGNTNGTTIFLSWDDAGCASTGYHMLYGNLATVSTYALGGSLCALNTAGSSTWSNVPAGSLWYVVVSDDAGVTEGSWGPGVAGGERNGGAASGQCGFTARSNTATCP